MDPTVWGIAPPQDRSRPAGPVWAHVPHRVGRLLMPLPRRRMGLSSDEERALSEGARLTSRDVQHMGGRGARGLCADNWQVARPVRHQDGGIMARAG